VLGGYVFGGLAAFFTFPFTFSALPVQNIQTWIPNGDGSATVVVPVQLSYNNLMQVPFYYTIPFSVVVYCSVFLGAVCTLAAIVSAVVEGVRWVMRVASPPKGDEKPVEVVPAPKMMVVSSPPVYEQVLAADLVSPLAPPDTMLWFGASRRELPSMVTTNHGRRPSVPFFLDKRRMGRHSADAAMPEEGAPVAPSGRRFKALVDVLARAGVDLDLAYGLQLGRMEFESSAVPLDLPDRAMVDVAAEYSEDSSMEEVIVSVPHTPQQTPRLDSSRRPSIAASALNRKFSAIPLPDGRGVWDASMPGRRPSIFSPPQTLELPLSAMQVRLDEVVDPSPSSPADALFGDGRARKFSALGL
jgi:hypothetical protein